MSRALHAAVRIVRVVCCPDPHCTVAPMVYARRVLTRTPRIMRSRLPSGAPFIVLRMHVGAARKQQLHHRQAAPRSGLVERRVPAARHVADAPAARHVACSAPGQMFRASATRRAKSPPRGCRIKTRADDCYVHCGRYLGGAECSVCREAICASVQQRALTRRHLARRRPPRRQAAPASQVPWRKTTPICTASSRGVP
jgi:hypothetical protein